MKGGGVVAIVVVMAIMSVGEANDLWPDCPTVCEKICGGAVGRTPDTFCTATCKALLCAFWPPTPPLPPNPTPPAEPPVPSKECPARCEDVCSLTHNPLCVGLCVVLFCPLQAAAPPTAALP